jgi:hypothetical protein
VQTGERVQEGCDQAVLLPVFRVEVLTLVAETYVSVRALQILPDVDLGTVVLVGLKVV